MTDSPKSMAVRFIGYMLVGPGEAHRWLSKALKDIEWCDDTCVCLNNADEASVALCGRLGCKLYFDNREWGKEQYKIKEDFFKKIVRDLDLKGGDWIIAKDADEIFDTEFKRPQAEELAKSGGTGYNFYVVNLYNDGYSKEQSFWNVRMWQYNPDWNNSWTRRNLHCGLYPVHIYRHANFAPFILWHYGLKKASDRKKKVERYKKYDPHSHWMRMNPSYYRFLESKAPVSQINLSDLQQRVERFAKQTAHKQSKEENMSEKIHYLKRVSDEMLIPVPERHLEETMKRKKDGLRMFEYQGEASLPDQKAEYQEAPVLDGYICDICGFEAKSEHGLNIHKKKHA